jgi:lysophospholipase L1-like esterase
MRADYSDDGVHPNAAGYAAMEAVLQPRLRAALSEAPG